jgi:hypothetical protein
MTPILWELLNCIFVDFPAQNTKLSSDDTSLKALYDMNTFFDKFKYQQEIYDDVSRFCLKCCFFLLLRIVC